MELAHKTLGQGPALLILHGLFGSLDNWLTLARQFGEHFSVYIIDQRNHGKSPWDERWDYDVMAEDLAGFMDQHGIPQAHILGHSMGGKTAMQFAAEYPDRITRLIVADIAPKAYPRHHDLILETLNETPLGALTSRQDAEDFMQSRISEPAVRQFLLKSLMRDPVQGFSWRFNLDTITRNYDNILANVRVYQPIEVPALFIAGGNSDYILPGDQQHILDLFPNASFSVIPNAGHWVQAEAPEAFLSLALGFLLQQA